MVDATIKGWYSYLYGDPAPANIPDQEGRSGHVGRPDRRLLRQDDEFGIVDWSDAKTVGIAAMTYPRWQSLYESAVAVGL